MIANIRDMGQVYEIHYADGSIKGVGRSSDEVKTWVDGGNTPQPQYTDEELAAIEAQKSIDEQEKARDAAMLAGMPYTLDGVDYMVSLTSTDGNGMLQVEKAMLAGLNTVILFKNGTKMPMAPDKFDAFAAWFLVKRNSFFV